MSTHGAASTASGLPAPVVLLEREREIAGLLAAADDTAAGTARLALVEGPAGIGKSRLLATLRSEGAVRGLRVLAARGSELELEFPFGVVRQLFEPALADPAVRGRWLAGAAAPAAAVFSPPSEDEGDGRDASFAALHGLFWLTANAAADEPLLLSVDDLHWVDGPSLRYIAYLARRLEGLPVLLVLGLRSGEPGADPVIGVPMDAEQRAAMTGAVAAVEAGMSRFGRGRLYRNFAEEPAAASRFHPPAPLERLRELRRRRDPATHIQTNHPIGRD